MANMTIDENVFQLPIDVTENGVVEKVLQTANSYVDKNIKVKVTTPDATYKVIDEGSIVATASTTDTTYTSDTVTPYAITIAADATVSDVKVGVDAAGFAASTDTVTVTGGAAEQATKTLYIKEGALSSHGTASATGGNGVELTKVGEQPETGFYIKASAAGGASVATAGWVDPERTQEVSVDGDSFYTIATAALGNTQTEGKEYTKVNAPVLVSGKGLYINEGYIENTYIPLADLVPDEATVKAGEGGNSHLIYKTVSVYDNDGSLIAGTMGDAVLGEIEASGVSAQVSTVSVAANGDGSAFNVAGTGAISGNAKVAVGTTGYATAGTEKTGVIAGAATVAATLPKIGIGIEVAENDVEVTPVIAKEDATTAKSGNITAVQPEGYYIAVSTSAIAKEANVTPVVSTEGYGTTDVNSATGSTIKAGAAASGTYYVPVTAGSHVIAKNASQVVKASTAVETNVSGTVDVTAGILSAAPTGDYITIGTTTTPVAGSVQTSSTCTVEEGYMSANTETTTISEAVAVESVEAAPKYIKIYDGSIL